MANHEPIGGRRCRTDPESEPKHTVGAGYHEGDSLRYRVVQKLVDAYGELTIEQGCDGEGYQCHVGKYTGAVMGSIEAAMESVRSVVSDATGRTAIQ